METLKMMNHAMLEKGSVPVQIIYLPEYNLEKWGPMVPKTSGSAGFDVRACIPEPLWVHPGQTVFISTGIKVHISDPGYMSVLYSRSGLGTKKGGVIAQGAGIIDSDYQGPVTVGFWNRLDRDYSVDAEVDISLKTIVIEPGELIAQLIFQPVADVKFEIVNSFTATERGEGGFGHTGTGVW